MILSAPIYTLKRRAKERARAQSIPLSVALDQLAQDEGFQNWSHLSAADAKTARAAKLLARLSAPSLILLAARPGQGKTLLGLELLVEALDQGRAGYFFTLEYTQAQARALIDSLAPQSAPHGVVIDTSDTLDASHIAQHLATAPAQSVVVIDYLQVLDQRRTSPPLNAQLETLRAVAQRRQITLICLSQVDRSYDPGVKPLPDLGDLRLPNPVDLNLFDQTIFMGSGKVQLRAAA